MWIPGVGVEFPGPVWCHCSWQPGHFLVEGACSGGNSLLAQCRCSFTSQFTQLSPCNTFIHLFLYSVSPCDTFHVIYQVIYFFIYSYSETVTFDYHAHEYCIDIRILNRYFYSSSFYLPWHRCGYTCYSWWMYPGTGCGCTVPAPAESVSTDSLGRWSVKHNKQDNGLIYCLVIKKLSSVLRHKDLTVYAND